MKRSCAGGLGWAGARAGPCGGWPLRVPRAAAGPFERLVWEGAHGPLGQAGAGARSSPAESCTQPGLHLCLPQVPLYERGYEKDPAKVGRGPALPPCSVCVSGYACQRAQLAGWPPCAGSDVPTLPLLLRCNPARTCPLGMHPAPRCIPAHQPPALPRRPLPPPPARWRLRLLRQRSAPASTSCWWTPRGACRYAGGPQLPRLPAACARAAQRSCSLPGGTAWSAGAAAAALSPAASRLSTLSGLASAAR